MHVSKLLIHPIKSCAGVSVSSATYDHNGFVLDRRWLIVDARSLKFYTARNLPKMVLIKTDIDVDKQELVVRIPIDEEEEEFRTPIEPDTDDLELVEGLQIWAHKTDGWAVSSEIDSALSAFLGKQVMLVLKGPTHRETGEDETYGPVAYEPKGTRFQDFYPILTCTTASLQGSHDAIRNAVKRKLVDLAADDEWDEDRCQVAIERWRPNIVIDGASAPFEEDEWQGFAVGPSEQIIYTVARCIRCMLPNVDPSTGVRDASIPWSVMQNFRVTEPDNSSNYCWGMHSVPAAASGVINVGDEVKVTQRHPNVKSRRQLP